MMRDMMKWCFGPDGRPDFEKMTEFMEEFERTRKFDALGWGLFFVWIGIAWLADVGLGIGFLGIAVITLGVQALRRTYGVRVEGFWVLVGIGFAVAGFWQWLDVQLPLAPFLLIAIGLAFIFGILRPKRHRSHTKFKDLK
jgi:hypothetical protein